MGGPRVFSAIWWLMPEQLDLFTPVPSLPQGFKYQPEFLSPADEQELVRRLAELPFKEFEFQG
jgi:hypothetical protein